MRTVIGTNGPGGVSCPNFRKNISQVVIDEVRVDIGDFAYRSWSNASTSATSPTAAKSATASAMVPRLTWRTSGASALDSAGRGDTNLAAVG